MTSLLRHVLDSLTGVLGLTDQDITTFLLLYIVPVLLLIAVFLVIYFCTDRNRYRRLVVEMVIHSLLEGKS